MPGSKRDGLARSRDVHPGEQLVDHLESCARARLVSKLVELGRHGIEHWPCLGKGIWLTGGEDGERTFCRAN